VTKYKESDLKHITKADNKPDSWTSENNRAAIAGAFKSSARQFVNLLPTLAGVVLLIGLFNALMSKELLSLVFSGNAFFDTLWGAC